MGRVWQLLTLRRLVLHAARRAWHELAMCDQLWRANLQAVFPKAARRWQARSQQHQHQQPQLLQQHPPPPPQPQQQGAGSCHAFFAAEARRELQRVADGALAQLVVA